MQVSRNFMQSSRMRTDFVLIALVVALVLTGLRMPLLHLVLSAAALAVLALHAWQHVKWFKALGKGKWPKKRVMRAVAVAVPGLLMLICCITGLIHPDLINVVLSWDASAVSPWAGQRGMFQAHHVQGYVCLGLCVLHALYLAAPRLRRKSKVA